MKRGIISALLAAALFGASTPFAKYLSGAVAPVMLAGLLYLGSGLGLAAWRFLQRGGDGAPAGQIARADWPWLGGAILAGGVAGPVLLMAGLAATPASSASLLLNVEGVLTALLAWFVFRENFDRRILIGMLFVVLAGALLSWSERPRFGLPWGPLAIIGACACWALDNNLTRKVSAGDAVQIACCKGLAAGSVNLAIALALGHSMPAFATLAIAATVGLLGYGISLVMFVVALRHLGTARTGAYFAAAPFAGALTSMLVFGERPGAMFWLAALLMGAGIWLHISETHDHPHRHEALEHDHEHVHDEHHQHEHGPDDAGGEPHAHRHVHAALLHAHPHFPDIHHRHEH